MNELRWIGRVAVALACLALLAGLSSLHGVRGRHGGGSVAGATFAGAVVTSLRPGGAADQAGLRVGDVVEAVNGTPGSHLDIERATGRAGPTDLRIRRGTQLVGVTLR